MSFVQCDTVTKGLRDSEALANVTDLRGRRHSIRVERDFLTQFDGKDYLPIGVVHIDPKSESVLIEFSHEPETGINRIWVKPEQLHQPVESYA